MIPFRVLPQGPGPDGFATPTSELQAKTEKDLRDAWKAAPKPLILQRMRHFQWLKLLLFQGLPAKYKAQDASQPWILFWIIQSFQIMGVQLDQATKQRAIDTVMTYQNKVEGGFGGGPLQKPGLLPTYAAISTLACVGRPGPGGGWDEIDRHKMYDFIMSLKQPDGSFLVSKDAEVDVRAVYAVLVIATLLDIVTPELVAGTASFIASTQTYEGGFASTSMPYYITEDTLLDEPRPAIGEAHGGYAGCSIASWAMLLPIMTDEESRQLDIPKFLRWLVWMQGEEEDFGGFRGRSNKLVDNCYSWWCGESLALVESLLSTQPETGHEDEVVEDDGLDDEWVDTEFWLYNNKALQEYILGVGQDKPGGLRDKPGKLADVYHTFYSLAGLSTAQHRVYQSKTTQEQLLQRWEDSDGFVPSGGSKETIEDRQSRRKALWAYSRSWKEDESSHRYVGSPNNRVNATHPIFTLLVSQSNAIMDYFYSQSTEKSSSQAATGQ
ncbi:CAAX farnesyltransferase (FTase) subunit beta [Serendipita sp. 399]|nr:CAAX farnesyltransferase (FTase) subunit beta [Serendipita sp. 399]